MKSFVSYLAVCLIATPLLAADSEVEQLRSEVQTLRQLVMQLTARVDQLEGKNSITRPTNSVTHNTQPEQSKGITIERITPPMRRLGQHAYYLESVQIDNNAIGQQKQEVIVNYKVQNYGNERWTGRAHPIISFGNEKHNTQYKHKTISLS
tara:strand:+ start:13479 stop:13931 length:453 start_codon:yes stop_codon:yes gene_type:complete